MRAWLRVTSSSKWSENASFASPSTPAAASFTVHANPGGAHISHEPDVRRIVASAPHLNASELDAPLSWTNKVRPVS